MNIVYSNLISNIERELSLVSKRMKGRDGSDMYAEVMVSSAEREALYGYIEDAVHDILSDIKQFIDIYEETSSGVSFEIVRTRKTSDWTIPEPALLSSIRRYIVSACIYTYLSPLYEVPARKFGSDSLRARRDVMELCYHKVPPVSSGLGISPTVTFNS